MIKPKYFEIATKEHHLNGIPPIQKHLPIDLIYEIFQDEHIKFHLEGSLDCY